MQYAPAAVAPAGQARSNAAVARELAKRMGLSDRAFSLEPHELVKSLFENAGPAFKGYADWDWHGRGPVKIDQPDAQVFATPSGKLEIRSQELADRGLDPVPNWTPEQPEVHDGQLLPLRLLTAPGYHQPHTAFNGVAELRKKEGAPHCILHPDEALSRGLVAGSLVALFNGRGRVVLELRISDEAPRGVALVPGQREDSDEHSGTVNMLCSDRYTDIGDGATYQSTWLEVAAA
jgi:anaerobic selenocysteine-containing dehydrogenase